MAQQFITVKKGDFGSGIDQLSPENNIAEGHVENLQDVDPRAEGHLSKRVGYQGYAGYLPVRVTRLDYTDDTEYNVCLTLDRAVDFSQVRSSPIVAYGRTKSEPAAGDWSQVDTAHYYPTFQPRIKKTLTASSVTTLTIPNSEHAQDTASLLVGTAESLSFINTSNSLFLPDSISIDTTTYELTIQGTNGTASDVQLYSYYLKQDTIAGSVAAGIAFSLKDGMAYSSTTVAAGTHTYTISQSSHQLGSNRIMATVYSVSGSTRTLIEPDEVRILASGDVEIDITAASSFTAHTILSTCPLSNYSTTSIVPSLATQSKTFAVTSPFVFPVIYRINGSILEQVLPDSFSVDADALEVTVSFTNDGVGANFEIYWQYGSISSNTICVTGTQITTPQQYTELYPQITLWGLNHEALYSSGKRGGWVNHIDSYRAAGDAFVVAGLGGNLFRSGDRATYGYDYLLPLLYPALRNRVSSSLTIGPAFWETGDSPLRTRGYITGDGGAAHRFTATSFTWNSGTGYTDILVSIPNMGISGTLSSIISTAAGLEDYLTIQQAPYSRLNGTFKILAASQASPTSLLLSVSIPAVDSPDWDDSGCAAQVGIFTDQITLSTAAAFLPGDRVLSEVFTNEEVVSVLASEGSTIMVDGLYAEYSLASLQRITGTRTSSVLPIRTLDETPSVDNLVVGDMLSLTGYTREPRIISINPNSSVAVTITGDGATATLTFGSGDTSAFTAGQSILLSQAGGYSGQQVISSINSLTELSFDSTFTDTESGILVGKTVELDESLEWTDSITSANSISVLRRWIPVEAPDDIFSLTPATTTYHWHSGEYDNRPIMRSVMSADNMYFVTGGDSVIKFDGTSVYRAGLPRWQPSAFVTTDTGATGKISITASSPFATLLNATLNDFSFKISTDDKGKFRVGSSILYSQDNSIYTIKEITEHLTDTFIIVDKPITVSKAGAQTLRNVLAARYYYRLNTVDSNDNVIASAIVGADDNVVRLSQDAAVHHKLVGFPAWDNYDFSRLEIEIYRTKFAPEWDASTLNDYYKIASIPLSFNENEGYISYTDTLSNDTLDTIDPTSLLTAGELGTQFSEPLVAKSITSAGNRLILGNIQDYPEMNLVMQSSGSIITAAVLTGKRWLLRRDNTDTGTASDITNRIGLEWVGTSGAKTISSVTSTASTFTVTTGSAHGQVAGNWVYLYASAVSSNSNPRYAGWFQVATVPTPTTFTVNDTSNWGTSGASDVDRMVGATLAGYVPVLVGLDGNYGTVNGNVDDVANDSFLFLGMRRLSTAINSVVRRSGVEPWVTAFAGNEYDAGQLILRVPRIDSTSIEMVLPTYTASEWRIYGNSVLRSSGESVGAVAASFPSRILISYPNYPEIFDNPAAPQDNQSVSAVDINTADGQEVTGVIPFFGSSAFGAAMQSGVVVVFKSNSIYLVDVAEKAKGNNPVQKIESAGLGCTAPGSICATKDGIMFANESGIYRLKRDLTVEYLGRRLERTWREEIDTEQLDVMAGHMYQATSRYKLSVPYIGDSAPSSCLVYDYTREYKMRIASPGQSSYTSNAGSWTKYTNHPAIGFCNLLGYSFMATTRGQVFTPRVTGEVSDYRDDAAAITARVTFGATDFGDSSVRKLLAAVIVHYRARSGVTENMTVSLAADLEDSFTALDESSVKADTAVGSGMGDTNGRKMRSIRYSVARRRLLYAQLQIENAEKDTPMEVSEIAYRITGLSEYGITQGPSTK